MIYHSSKTRKRALKAPLLGVTKAVLTALRPLAKTEKIFVNPHTRQPIVDVRRAITHACAQLNVQRFTLHHLRHLATTVLLEYTNSDCDLVKRIIRWSCMSMVDRYGHIGDRTIQAFAAMDETISKGLKL